MYDATLLKAFRSTSGGTIWQTITAGTDASDSTKITYLTVSPSDPKKLWLTISGFRDKRHVYAPAKGGTTWTNITGKLPNVPMNEITAYVPLG